MRKGWIFFLVFLAILITQKSYSRTNAVIDMAGRRVKVPLVVKRVVCLGPGTLRLLIYLRATDRVVGVEDIEKRFPFARPYWIANQWMNRVPTVGPGGPSGINKMPDMEAVLAVRPDVIFVTYMERAKADSLQRRLSIPVVILSYGEEGTVNSKIYESLKLMGRILSVEHRASQVISFIERCRNELLDGVSQYPDEKKPTVYAACIGFRGLHGVESTEASYIPFEWTRARNLAKRIKEKGHVFVDKEQVLLWDPEIIFIDGAGLSILRQEYSRKRKFYEALSAFKNKQVFILYPYNWYATNVGTAISDAYAVAKILYPKEFNALKLQNKVNEIYQFLVGCPLYSEMSELYGGLLSKPSFLK